MIAELGTLRSRELNVAITSAVVGIYNAHLAREPKTATTVHRNNMIVAVMSEVMTHAERTLARHENEDAVSHVHHLRASCVFISRAFERLRVLTDRG